MDSSSSGGAGVGGGSGERDTGTSERDAGTGSGSGAPPPGGHGPLAVVAIGASAGGLSALRQLFEGVPSDTGASFVVVVHLSPEHESYLADLLQPSCTMPVQQVADTVQLEPDHVYVIPPNRNLSTIDTHLRLTELEEERRERAPIDHFFRTLADTHDGHAIGLVLTGTGSDGALGMRRIKERGGITLVQDPAEAEYDGMPQSAIATGAVDMILPLHDMPAYLVRLIRSVPSRRMRDADSLQEDQRRALQRILTQVRARSGRDFSRYKESTVLRRVTRRMQLQDRASLPDYLELLRTSAPEAQALADELLINVTEFFRDPVVFETLEARVVPGLFADKGAKGHVRAWSVGCATGEEAYSLAILLLEEAVRHDDPPQIQVFATDLHERSLSRAREGLYPETIETNVSPERLRRFFKREAGGYRVRKEVREAVVFTPHNLLGDPPFSRLDLVSCRNVLIYLQRDIQRDVIDLFHYALVPDGVLLLGNSETIERGESFRMVDQESCVYRKRNVPAKEPRLPVFPISFSSTGRRTLAVAGREEPPGYSAVHLGMIEQYAPPSLLVSPDDEIVHLSEQAGRYLQPPGGAPTSNLFKLVREELRLELRSALRIAREKRTPCRSEPVSLFLPNGRRDVAVDVRPATDAQRDGFSLVIFDEREPAAGALEPRAESDATVRELEAELQMARQRLQAVVEEYETSQEEMRAGNEELQSMNEELRSTMEELETSREELQSVNEELVTVNQENRHKVDELGQLAGDLQNLMAATDIATVFLDRTLRIQRFTPRLGELFNIRSVDRGRPLGDLTHRLGYPEMLDDAGVVLERLVPVEREVRSQEGNWYLTRVLPYRSSADRIEGVVITFVDITELRRAEATVRELNAGIEVHRQQGGERARELARLFMRAERHERARAARLVREEIEARTQQARGELGAALDGGSDEQRGDALRAAGAAIDGAGEAARLLRIELELPAGEGDLAAVAHDLAEVAARRYDLVVDLAVDVPQPDGAVAALPPGLRLLLVNGLRDLLHNVARHAGVRRARLELSSDGATLRAAVVDEGSGFDPEAVLGSDGDASTLPLLRRCARLLGGDLRAEASPPRGSAVTLVLPLEPEADEAELRPGPP